MESQGLENINIDKYKELFEYEMTEVILNLKGEFAHFSGKGTKFENTMAEAEKLDTGIPAVEIKQPEFKRVYISVPEVKPVPAVSGAGKDGKAGKDCGKEALKVKTVKLPEIPEIPAVARVSKTAEASVVKLPEIPAVPVVARVSKTAEASVVKLPEIPSVPVVARVSKTAEAITVKLPAMPEIPGGSAKYDAPGIIPVLYPVVPSFGEIKVQKAEFVPAKVEVPEVKPVDISTFSVEKPEKKIVPEPEIPDIRGMISSMKMPSAAVVKPSVAMPEIAEFRNIKAEAVKKKVIPIPDIDISIPAIPNIF